MDQSMKDITKNHLAQIVRSVFAGFIGCAHRSTCTPVSGPSARLLARALCVSVSWVTPQSA
jgi:hypothetical protein